LEGPNVSTNILFLGANCAMPILAAKIDADGRCSHGFEAISSRGIIMPGGGVINAGRMGLYGVTAHIRATGTDWRFAGREMFPGYQAGIWATNGSIINAQQSIDYRTNVSGSSAIGAGTSRASFLNVNQIIANQCQNGIEARRGLVHVQNAD